MTRVTKICVPSPVAATCLGLAHVLAKLGVEQFIRLQSGGPRVTRLDVTERIGHLRYGTVRAQLARSCCKHIPARQQCAWRRRQGALRNKAAPQIRARQHDDHDDERNLVEAPRPPSHGTSVHRAVVEHGRSGPEPNILKKFWCAASRSGCCTGAGKAVGLPQQAPKLHQSLHPAASPRLPLRVTQCAHTSVLALGAMFRTLLGLVFVGIHIVEAISSAPSPLTFGPTAPVPTSPPTMGCTYVCSPARVCTCAR